MTAKAAVIGGGSWGTTIASLLADATATTLWCRSPHVAKDINTSHKNPAFLGELALTEQLQASTDPAEALAGATVVAVAAPSQAVRPVMAELADQVEPEAVLVSLTKGFEADSCLRASQVLAELFPSNPIAVLSGPNLARETLQGHPTATVVATADQQLGVELQELFTTAHFRVYTSADVVGVELAGGIKNVIALAAGVAVGYGAGHNTQAALVSRGLAEMMSLGSAIGAKPETFAGLAGMGDLLVTCFSDQSRNRSVGIEIGRGHSVAQAIAETKQVAEGVEAAVAVVELASQHGVEMPICQEVWEVIYNGSDLAEAAQRLLNRPLRPETG